MKQLLLWWILVLITLCSRAGTPDSLLQQATRYFMQSNYSGALATYTALAHRSEVERNDTLYVHALTGIGDCHYYLRDKTTALRWYHAALHHIRQQKMNDPVAPLHYKISLMFIELGTVDSAEYYASRAIQVFRQQKDNVQLSRTLSALADLYINKTKNYKKAEALIREALQTALQTGNHEVIGFANMKYFFLHYFNGHYQEALRYVNEAAIHYNQTEKAEDIQYAILFQTYCRIRLRDTSAIHYLDKWFQYKDSVFQRQKAGTIAELQTVYETEKKERENKILQQQAEISQLQLKARNRTILVLLALLLGAGMFGVWRYNAGRLKKKQQELELLAQLQKDKERIARDLHDHVGGQLSFLVHSVDGITEDPPEKRVALKASMLAALRNVIAGLRETIWAIHDEQIAATDFMDKLKVFTRNLYQHSTVRIHFSEQLSANRELHPLPALNLYRMCQEIIQNSFKHARATDLWVECAEADDRLCIRIRDNGVGFDTATAVGGRGLENIRSRAAEFQIDVQIHTGATGTSYTLLV